MMTSEESFFLQWLMDKYSKEFKRAYEKHLVGRFKDMDVELLEELNHIFHHLKLDENGRRYIPSNVNFDDLRRRFACFIDRYKKKQ